MSPQLKQLHRRVQHEFFKNRQSKIWRRLKKTYKKLKKKTIRKFYSNFVNELKSADPGKWWKLAKKIGAIDQSNGGDIKVDSLQELTDSQAAEKIASHFSSIANEYLPIDVTQLPSYLPAPPPPQVNEYTVYKKIEKLKKTRSTLSLDLPNQLRKELLNWPNH